MKNPDPNEDFALERLTCFDDALLTGKPLVPKHREWSVGELLFLKARLEQLLKNLPCPKLEQFQIPLSTYTQSP